MVDWKKLKRRIPRSVQVGKSTYEVLWTDDFKDGTTLGETRFDPKQIIIKKGLSPKLTVHVYFHEFLHSVSHETGANLTENQVLALEKAFYYFVKVDNLFRGNR